MPTCGNRQRVRVDRLSAMLIEHIERIAVMSDDAILAALKLQSSRGTIRSLEAELKRLQQVVKTADNARHALTKLLASNAMTQADVEVDLFEHRRDKTAAETRIREIESELSRQHARPDFDHARGTLKWLREHWMELTVRERAEALRLLVDKVTYEPNATVNPDVLQVVSYGRAFIDPSAVPAAADSRKARSNRA